MTVLIRQIKPSEKPLLEDELELLQSLGEDYLNSWQLVNYATNGHVLCAFAEGHVVGIVIPMVMSIETIQQFNNYLSKDIQLKGRIGRIKAIAVRESERKQGIGTSLVQACLWYLKDLGCESFFAVSWDTKSPFKSKTIFENLDWDMIHFAKEFWKDKRHNCPECEGSVCKCDALFYFTY